VAVMASKAAVAMAMRIMGMGSSASSPAPVAAPRRSHQGHLGSSKITFPHHIRLVCGRQTEPHVR
jgi:hypothetical protein